MAFSDSIKVNKNFPVFEPGKTSEDNPVEDYQIEDIVARIAAAQDALDEKVYAFLTKVNSNDRIVGNFNVNEEWRCWLEQDREASRMLFASDLTEFDNEASDCFKECYASELVALLNENDAIDKMAQSLDEYRLFKTCLFNVFNNENNLPPHLFYDQVFNRAKEYGMTIKRHSKADLDIIVAFDPLGQINRGDAFFSYEFYLRFNQNHKKECYMYSICMMDAVSSDVMFSGPVDLPIYNAFAKFSKETDAYFLTDHNSIFYQQSLRAHRKKEKCRYGIPSDYFEGTFIDPKKLNNFSEKSYQYGNSKIFIPKSQVAFAGEKVYIKPWLYAKLKRPVEAFEGNLRKKETMPSLDDKVASAAEQAAEARHSGPGKNYMRDSEERS